MVNVLNKYRLIFIVTALIILGLISWLILSRQDVNKIPSRGVFVKHFQNKVINQA